MSGTIQLRRGTTSEVAAITPAVGEPVWDTTLDRLWVGDGSTLGGIPQLLMDANSKVSISSSEPSAGPGTYSAGFKTAHTNALDITSGRLCAMSINCEPAAGKDAFKVVGGEVCTYLTGTTTVSGMVTGLFVETQGGGTLGSDFYSLYVYYAPSAVPSGSSAVVRLENNASADNRCNTFLSFVGGKGETAMSFGPLATQTAWSTEGDITGDADGWLLVKVGSENKKLQLYN